MSLFETIQNDMYAAMKSRDKAKAAALRGALAKLKDRRIEKRDDLTAAEELKVIQSLVKQRRESVKMYSQGGRDDLVKQEEFELEILQAYLPQELSEEEIRAIVSQVITETGATSLSDMGKIMPAVMRVGQGRINGKLAQQVVRELLG
ncbi:MAG: GatB/YqeY domain-containing protein [Fidelibacterota bacterium]